MRWLCFCQLWLACVGWCLAQYLALAGAWQPSVPHTPSGPLPDCAEKASTAQVMAGVVVAAVLPDTLQLATRSLVPRVCAQSVPSQTILLPLVSGPLTGALANHTYGTLPAQPGDVVINEIAWGGTSARSSDEWLELANATLEPVSLTGWSLVAVDGTPAISLAGTIQPSGYYLLEREHDLAVADVIADMIYVGELDDHGEQLQLLDAAGRVIDTANIAGGPWPAGDGAPDHPTMERISPLAPDVPGSWANHLNDIRNGHDRSGNPINGTPRQPNSTSYPVRPGDVVISEVAWGGTQASANDEWLELFNRRPFDIDLTGWQLRMGEDVPLITLQGTIATNGYYLIERDDDNTVTGVAADLVTAFAADLADQGGSLRLVTGTLTIDTANADGGPWPAGSAAPEFRTMERLAPDLPDADDSWGANDAFHRNGLDRDGQPINGTPGLANSSTLPPALLISEVLYAGTVPNTQGDEFVELCNLQPGPVRLDGLKIGDEETRGGDEGMYRLPAGRNLGPDECLVIAKNAAGFASRFGFYPDFEMVVSGANYPDTPEVPQLERYLAWSGGSWALADAGDEIVLLGPTDQRLDGMAYGQGDYLAAGVTPAVRANRPNSLQRIWPFDSNAMAADFLSLAPNPNVVTPLPAPPASSPPAADLPGGMHAYCGLLAGHTSYSDGNGPPLWAFASGRAHGLHFLAVTDPGDSLDAIQWLDIGAQAAAASRPGEFVALRGFEYRVPDQGTMIVWSTSDFVSPADPAYDSLGEFYAWLAGQSGALAGFSPLCVKNGLPALMQDAPFSLPLYLWRVDAPSDCGRVDLMELSWLRALAVGWSAAPANLGSDAGWGATNSWRVGLVAPALSQTDLLEALRARRAFATQDASLALGLRSGQVWMGDSLACPAQLALSVHLARANGHSLPITLTVYDGTAPVAAASFEREPAEWTPVVAGQPGHFYWVRAVQADGSIAQTAPLRCTGDAQPETVVLNEVLPAPRNVDWDGNGVSDGQDEWIELYNHGSRPVGLGGWQLRDASGASYLLPLSVSLGPHSYTLFFRQQTELTLNNDSDALTLVHLDGTAGDSLQYAKGPGYDKTLCRLPDGVGGWQGACSPTPGGPNQPLPAPTPKAEQTSEPIKTDILGARHLTPGARVKIRGQITLPPGVLSQRIAYLQDANSGIRLYLPKDHRLTVSLGDRVEVVGRLSTVRGELQVTLSKGSDLRHVRASNPLPPLPMASGMLSEPYEGMLVLLSGQVTACGMGGSFWVDDGSGAARVYLDPDARLGRPCKKVGQLAQVVGIVSQYRQPHEGDPGYRLLPRYTTDISTGLPVADTVKAALPASSDWAVLLPEAGGPASGCDSYWSSYAIAGGQSR